MPDRVAIGAENGIVSFVRAKSPGGHKVVDPGTRIRRDTIDVPCVTLDTWCERLAIDPREVSFDLNRHASGPRVQPTSRLEARLRHLSEGSGGRTDILAFRLASPGVGNS